MQIAQLSIVTFHQKELHTFFVRCNTVLGGEVGGEGGGGGGTQVE
jgi:hypothetical protein